MAQIIHGDMEKGGRSTYHRQGNLVKPYKPNPRMDSVTNTGSISYGRDKGRPSLLALDFGSRELGLGSVGSVNHTLSYQTFLGLRDKG